MLRILRGKVERRRFSGGSFLTAFQRAADRPSLFAVPSGSVPWWMRDLVAPEDRAAFSALRSMRLLMVAGRMFMEPVPAEMPAPAERAASLARNAAMSRAARRRR